MQINVLAFGQVAVITGNNFQLNEQISDTDHLQNVLKEHYPALSEIKFAVAVNKQMIKVNTPIQGDE